MKLFWTRDAEEDRLHIWHYIAADNPLAAMVLDERFTEAAEKLAAQPYMGIAGETAGTREFLAHENYRLVYEVRDEGLFVLAVVHVARQWPALDSD